MANSYVKEFGSITSHLSDLSDKADTRNDRLSVIEGLLGKAFAKGSNSGSAQTTLTIGASFQTSLKGLGASLTRIDAQVTTALSVTTSSFNETMGSLSTTIDRIIGRVQATVSTIVSSVAAEINTALTQTVTAVQTVITAVTNAFTGTISTITGSIQNIIATIQASVSTVFDGIRTHIDGIVGSIAQNIQSVIQSAQNVINGVVTGIETVIGAVLNTVQGFLNGIVATLQTVIGTIQNALQSVIGTVFGQFQAIITQVQTAISTLIGHIVQGVQKIIQPFVTIAQNIAGAITGTLEKITSVVTNFITPIQQAILSVIGQVEAIISSVQNMVTQFSQAFASLTGSVQAVSQTITEIGSSLKNINQILKNFTQALQKMNVKSLRTSFKGLISEGLKPLKSLFLEGRKTISDFFKSVRTLSKGLKSFGKALQNFAKALTHLTKNGKKLRSKNLFPAIGKNFKGVSTILSAFASNIILTIAPALKKLAWGIRFVGVATAQAGAAMLANPMVWIIGGIIAAVAALGAAAYLIYKNWEPISAWFAAQWLKIKDIFEHGQELFTNFFGITPLDAIQAAFQPVIDFFGNLFQWIGEKFASIWQIATSVGKLFNFFGDDPVGAHNQNQAQAQRLKAASEQLTSIATQQAIAQTYQSNDQYSITITPQPGQNPEAIARAVQSQLKKNKNAFAYDLGGADIHG